MDPFVQQRRPEYGQRFFQQERLSQYEPYSEQRMPDVLSIDTCRYVIGRLIWPRLVVLRAKTVLVALMPILNLSSDGTYGVILHELSSVISPLGWVLHGLRLFINTLTFLQKMMLDKGMHNTEQDVAWLMQLGAHLQGHGVAMGNDVIWILAAIAPTTLDFTCGFLLIDIVWLSIRTWFELARLEGLRDAVDETTDPHLFCELTNACVLEQQKGLLNMANLLSISAISILKNFVLPAFLPVLAVNPWVMLALSLLSLVITITCHMLGQRLVAKKPSDVQEKTDGFQVNFAGI